MNLGTRPEDEGTPQSSNFGQFHLGRPDDRLEESFGVEVSDKIKQMGAQVEDLLLMIYTYVLTVFVYHYTNMDSLK